MSGDSAAAGPQAVRRFNFSPGPAALPRAVMERAQREFLCLPNGSTADQEVPPPVGFGPIELTNLDAKGASHPGEPSEASPAQGMLAEAEAKLRKILNVPGPDEYRVLFVHGGAVGQFSSVPLNIGCGEGVAAAKADYVDCGFWSKRAATEAQKYVDVKEVPGTRLTAEGKTELLPPAEWDIRPDAAYVHVTLNETVQGLEFRRNLTGAGADEELRFDWPADKPPLVGDATSTLLSRPVNVRDFGILYASGGKNVPPGVTVVIVRTSLLTDRKAHAFTPQVMDYRMSGGGLMPQPSVFESKPNTPPIFATYMLGLVLDDLNDGSYKGDLGAVGRWIDGRAKRVYDAIAASEGFYRSSVDEKSRSHMSIVFRIREGEKDLESLFASEAAEKHGLHYLFAHPVSGGVRITTYNGVPDEALDAALAFMDTFRQAHA